MKWNDAACQTHAKVFKIAAAAARPCRPGCCRSIEIRLRPFGDVTGPEGHEQVLRITGGKRRCGTPQFLHCCIKDGLHALGIKGGGRKTATKE
jgi:hypothetical protein